MGMGEEMEMDHPARKIKFLLKTYSLTVPELSEKHWDALKQFDEIVRRPAIFQAALRRSR